jgi:hypothetical protein
MQANLTQIGGTWWANYAEFWDGLLIAAVIVTTEQHISWLT